MSVYYETQRDSNGDLTWKTFGKYNTQEAIDLFDPEENGAKDAVHHSIDVDANELTDTELEMVNHVKDHLHELTHYVSRQLDEADKDAHQISGDIGLPEVDAENIKADFDASVRNRRADLKAEIRPIIAVVDQSKRFLNYFRFKNGLMHRPAIYPENFTYEIGLLAILLIAEAVVNSIFFAHGSSLGLLGGWLEALLVSLANVCTSFIAGFLCLRYAHHKSLIKIIPGVLGFLAAILSLIFLHLATAHYRELAIKSVDANFSDVLASTINNPLGITDLYSLILILVGVGISILVCYKGLHFDDVYPGYGKIWRRFEKSNNDIEVELKKYREELVKLQADNTYKLNDVKRNIGAIKKYLIGIMSDVDSFMSDYESYVDQAKLGAETLVSKYRHAYQQIISDACNMSYKHELIPDIQSRDYLKRSEKVKKSVTRHLAEIEQKEEAFLEKYDSILGYIQDTVSSMSGDKALKEINNEVLANIVEDYKVDDLTQKNT